MGHIQSVVVVSLTVCVFMVSVAAKNPAALASIYEESPGLCALGPASALLAKARSRLLNLPSGGRPDATIAEWLINIAQFCPWDAKVLDEVGEGLRLVGRSDLARDVYHHAARRGVWRHPLQRIFKGFNPKLRSAPLLGPEAFGELPELRFILDLVQPHLSTIKTEIMVARGRSKCTAVVYACQTGTLCWSQSPAQPRLLRPSAGTWSHFWLHENGRCDPHCPRLCAAVRQIEESGLRLMNVLVSEVAGPYTYIGLHRSLDQTRLRMLCPLMFPAGGSSVMRFPRFKKKKYVPGECFWFDESYEHDMVHVGDSRSALILDVEHPGTDGRSPVGTWTDNFRRNSTD